jgi:hypothetical protein
MGGKGVHDTKYKNDMKNKKPHAMIISDMERDMTLPVITITISVPNTNHATMRMGAKVIDTIFAIVYASSVYCFSISTLFFQKYAHTMNCPAIGGMRNHSGPNRVIMSMIGMRIITVNSNKHNRAMSKLVTPIDRCNFDDRP